MVNVIEGKATKAAVLLGISIDTGGVEKLQRVQEELGIFLGSVLDSKVVNNKGESEGSCAVFEKVRGDGDRCITVRSKEFDEAIIGEATSLGQLIHKRDHCGRVWQDRI